MSSKKGCKEDKDCCSNKTEYFQSDNDLILQSGTYFQIKELQHFIIAFTRAFLTPQLEGNRDILAFDYYRPPLLQKDIPILIQSFLL